MQMSEIAYLWIQMGFMITLPLVLGIIVGKIEQMSSLSKACWMKLILLFSLIGIALIVGNAWKITHEITMVKTPWTTNNYQKFIPDNSLIFEKGTRADLFFLVILIINLSGTFLCTAVQWVKKKHLNDRLIKSVRTDASLVKLMHEVQTQWKMSDPVVIMRSSEVSAPCLVHLKETCILIPEQFHDQQLNWCIAHELAHHQNDDLLMGGMIRILKIVFWFHPLVWVFKKKYLEIQEMACDERITSKMSMDDKVEYLKLLERTIMFAKDKENVYPEICLARKTQIGRRAEKIMKYTPSSKRNIVFSIWIAFMFCIMTLTIHATTLFTTEEAGKMISPASSKVLRTDVLETSIHSLNVIDDSLPAVYRGFSQRKHGVYLSSYTGNFGNYYGELEDREPRILAVAQLDENDVFQLTLSPAEKYFDLVVCGKRTGCRVVYFDERKIILTLTDFEEDTYCFMLKDKMIAGYYLDYQLILAIR